MRLRFCARALIGAACLVAASVSAAITSATAAPGDYRFELAAGPDAHNDRVRFTWQLVHNGDGVPVATGYDFGTLAQDGRLQSVTGFLETPQQ